MAEDEKKSLLQQVMEPFIMGAQHSVSALRGGLEDQGILNVGGKLAMDALGGMGMNPIKVPGQKVDIANMVYQTLPEVTPIGSFLQHPAVQSRGGDLAQALGNLFQRRYGDLPKSDVVSDTLKKQIANFDLSHEGFQQWLAKTGQNLTLTKQDDKLVKNYLKLVLEGKGKKPTY